jgi:hypothetical protein
VSADFWKFFCSDFDEDEGLIDQAEARLWLNNAATLIEEDKTAFTKSRGEAITIIREELVSLLD